MSDLHKRQAHLNQMYVEDWLPEHKEMKIVQDIMVEYLKHSEQQICHLMDYHKAIFYQQFPIKYLTGIPEDAHLMLSPSNVSEGVHIKAKEGFLVQDEEGMKYQNDLPVSCCLQGFDLLQVHHKHTKVMYEAPFSCIDLQPSCEQETNKELHITFPITLTPQETQATLIMECQQEAQTKALQAYMIGKDVGCSLYEGDMDLGACTIVMQESQLLLTFPQRENTCTSMTLLFTYQTSLPEANLQNIRLYMRHHDVTPNQILVAQQEQDITKFCLFSHPLELYQETYIKCDALLSKPQTRITITGRLHIEKVLIGKEFLIEQDYKPIMRSLPKQQTIFEAFLDHVQLQYFHGEFSKIPKIVDNVNWKQDGSFSITFPCPQDIEPCMVENEQGYWIRFVLLKSENCYQVPCYHHIPWIYELQFHAEETPVGCAPSQAYHVYGEVSIDLLDKIHTQGSASLQIKETNTELVFHMNDTIQKEMHLYVELAHQYTKPQQISVSYDSFQGKREVYVNDETEGLSHDGAMTIYLPKDIQQTTQAGMSGCWISLGLPEKPQRNRILSITQGYMKASLKKCEIKTYEVPASFPITIQQKGITSLWVKEEDDYVAWQLYAKKDDQKRHAIYDEESEVLTIPFEACPHAMHRKASIDIQLEVFINCPNKTLERGTSLQPDHPHLDISEVTLIKPLLLHVCKETQQHQQARVSRQLSKTCSPYSLHGIECLIMDNVIDVKEVQCTMKPTLLCVHVYSERPSIWPSIHKEIESLLRSQLPAYYLAQLQIKKQLDMMIDVVIRSSAPQNQIIPACEQYLAPYLGHMGKYPSEEKMKQILVVELQDTYIELHLQGEAIIEDMIWQKPLSYFHKIPHGVLQLRNIVCLDMDRG